MRDPDDLLQTLHTKGLLPAPPDALVLDTSTTSPGEAARQVIDWASTDGRAQPAVHAVVRCTGEKYGLDTDQRSGPACVRRAALHAVHRCPAPDLGLRQLGPAQVYDFCDPLRVEILPGILVFIGGLLAKPLADLAGDVVRQIISRRHADAATATAQADRAAERCWESLAVFRADASRHLARKRRGDQGLGQDDLAARLLAAAAQLDANVQLLRTEAREPMTLVLDVLRSAERIDSEAGAPFSHYDSAFTMLDEAVSYGRQVLVAHIHREKLPPMPRKLEEYAIALEDERGFWESEGLTERELEEEERLRKFWIDSHRAELKRLDSHQPHGRH